MNGNVPRVSIGMPVYNGGDLLPQALDALLAQTYTDFELIVSDNASTDETESICRDYAARDQRIRYIRQEKNLGAVPNFNRVFEVSRGEYFKWASHDDLCGPTFIERCVEVLDGNPDIAWCHTRSSHIDAEGNTIDVRHLSDVSYVDVGDSRLPTRALARPHQRLWAVMLGEGGCLDSYGLIRSRVIRKTPLYMPCYGAEKVFTAELALRGRFAEIPETLFFYRLHEQASSGLTTAESQQQYMSTDNPKRFAFTRLRLLRGYVSAVLRAELTLLDRFRCASVIGRYLLQLNKWFHIVRKTLGGRGLTGNNLVALNQQKSPEEQTFVPS